MLDTQEAHASDLAELEELADRFGVPVYEGKPGRHLHAAGLGATRRAGQAGGRRAPGCRVRAMETRLLIRGEQVAGEGAPLAVENPATEETVAEVGAASPEQLDAAVAGAPRGRARAGRPRPPSSAPSCCTRWPTGCAR